MNIPSARLMYWSVRCELWENRSIRIAPLAVADVVLFGYLISLLLPNHMPSMTAAHEMDPVAMLAMPYSHAAWLIVLAAFLAGFFYCLDALYGERRDRSILFWKSLPVSDLTAVLSKLTIPLVVLPLVSFAIILGTQLAMLLMAVAFARIHGTANPAPPLLRMQLPQLYGLAAMALWHAPIYGWLLLVSGWARRATFLWVLFPPLAIGIFEKIAFGTSHFHAFVGDRVAGFASRAFAFTMPDGAPLDPHFIPLGQLTPGKFLATPGLWVGLLVAALFVAAAARLRRDRGPI